MIAGHSPLQTVEVGLLIAAAENLGLSRGCRHRVHSLQGNLQGIFDFLPSNLHSVLSKLHIPLEKVYIRLKSEQGINREVSGKQSSDSDQEQGIYLDLSRGDRREAKLPTLLGPAERNVGAEPSERQVVRLTSFQDGLDDVRGEEGAPEDFPDVSFRKASVTCERSLIECVAFQHARVPAMCTARAFRSAGLVLEADVAVGFGGTIR